MEKIYCPEWLTHDFLRKCLESDRDNFSHLKVTNFKLESAVEAGNNIKSNMLRVKIQYKNEDDEGSISLIVKMPVTSGVMAMDSLKEVANVLYDREPKYYNEFIKSTFKLSKHDIVPKPYLCSIPQCVVLEDLTSSGYILVDRHKLLDFDHCQLYVKASAKLHALSVAVNKKNPVLIHSLVKETPEMTKRTHGILKTLLKKGLSCMCAYLEDKPKYKDHLDVFKCLAQDDKLFNLFQEMMKTDHPLRAMIEEDIWCSNMMFKYNESGKVTNVKIFDFQRLNYTTPVMELVVFIWGSMNPDVRETKLNLIYYLYCDSLNRNLLELGCPERLMFDKMKEEIDSLSPMVLLIVCVILPMHIADGVVEVKDYVTKDCSTTPVKQSPFYKLYESSYFNKYYPQILDQLAKEGVFDYLKKKVGMSIN